MSKEKAEVEGKKYAENLAKEKPVIPFKRKEEPVKVKKVEKKASRIRRKRRPRKRRINRLGNL